MITVYSSIFQKTVQVPVQDFNPLRMFIKQKCSVSSHIASKSGPEDESKKLDSATPSASPMISPRPLDAPEPKPEPKLAEAPTMPVASVIATTTVVMSKPTCHCSCTC